MNYVKIMKGGILNYHSWNKEIGAHEIEDVSDRSPAFLFRAAEIEEGATLEDICRLLDQNIEIFDAVIGNWCENIVRECLDNDPETEEIASIDLIRSLTINKDWENEEHREISGFSHLTVSGTGNDGTNYGIELTPVNNLKNAVVKMHSGCTIFDEASYYEEKNYGQPEKHTETFQRCSSTLGDILNSVIWELSFFGGPASRDTFRDELNERVENLNEEDFIPMDELLDHLKQVAEENE